MKDTVLALGDLFNVLPDAVVVVDREGHIAFASAAVEHLLGYEPKGLLGQPLARLIPQRWRDEHARQVAWFRDHGEPKPMGMRPVLQALHRDGHDVPVSISIANLELSGERYSVAVVRDATPVRDQLGEAIARAESDPLTGLGNRLCLSQRMQEPLALGRPFGLLYLDLTRFKSFNDRYGHQVGDEVLRIVAKRIQSLVRAVDMAARIGGDEFVILLDGLSEDRLLAERAAAVAESVSRPFHALHVSGTVGVNIGGALCPRDGRTEAELLAAADHNMFRAKRAGCPYRVDAEATPSTMASSGLG